MDTGPQKESDTPQEAGRQRRKRQRERRKESKRKKKAFQGQAKETGGK